MASTVETAPPRHVRSATMLASSELVAFVPTTDLSRARAFYEGVLGLRFVEENPIACVFDADGTTLRVTLLDAVFSPAPYTVLGWVVADVAATVADLTDVGVTTQRFEGMAQDDAGVWTAPGGARVAWFKDPDGNVLSVTQLGAATSAPS